MKLVKTKLMRVIVKDGRQCETARRNERGTVEACQIQVVRVFFFLITKK